MANYDMAKYEAELTKASERLQKALGDYMGVGMLCVDAAIEKLVAERDELRRRLEPNTQ